VSEGRRDTILLVEDTAPSRYVVCRMLVDAGFEVIEAANAREAIAMAARQPDMVVLDINLPDMSGFEVCRILKTDPNTSAIPVLHLSASYVRADDYARGLNAGADGYLTHPVDDIVLIATVKAILRARRAEESSRRAEAEARRLYALAEERASELEQARNIAEAANRAKDQFLAVLSHELRTPLAPVFMIVGALEMDMDVPPRVREQLSIIRRNVELETKLIDDLLDLSRITNNKLRLEPGPLTINELVRHVLTVCAADIHSKRIRARWDLTAAHDEVMADSARLHQALWNLIKNAVKFTPEEGLITVRTSNPDPGRIRIEVEDNGVGIEPTVLPKIFDAFEQGDSTQSRQFGGLGLGLAISRAIVKLHGGTLSAHSEGKGKGARFVLELPATISGNADESSAPAPPPSRVANGLLRLLVVEDHYDTAQALSRLLRKSGYQVKTAGDAKSALQLAGAEKFNLLISDLGLPDSTGYDLMRELQQKHGLRGIAMSGFGMEDDLKKSRDAGFAEHLVKPISLAQLEHAIQRVVDSPAGK
jgi:signal transduction histidine kinase